MRFNIPPIVSPSYGDTRIISAFLFIPITLNNQKRWLEYTSWVEIYNTNSSWIPICWNDYSDKDELVRKTEEDITDHLLAFSDPTSFRFSLFKKEETIKSYKALKEKFKKTE